MRVNQTEVLVMQASILPPTDNMTAKMFDQDSSEAYININRIQTCILPIICVFGLLANTLAIRTFLSGYMRTSSCSIYLAAKCMSDNGFLLAMAVVWSQRLRVPLFNTQGVCQITIFVSYTCSFLSVWFMAIITCENYIRIAHSSRVSNCCTTSRALVVTAIFSFIAIMLNIFNFWTTNIVYTNARPLNDSSSGNRGDGVSVDVSVDGIVVVNESLSHSISYSPEASARHASRTGECVSLQIYKDFLITMTYVDSMLTLLLPSIFMFVLVVSILYNVLISVRRRKRLRAGTQRAHGIKRLVTPQAKMIRFLLAVSLIFLILHTPSHVIRIKMTVSVFIFGSKPTNDERIAHRVFEILYNLNFCNNFIIYLVFGDNFRRTFCELFFRRFKQKKERVVSQSDRHDYVQSEMTELVLNPS